MEKKSEKIPTPGPLFEAWMKSASDFWSAMTKTRADTPEQSGEKIPPDGEDKGRVHESMESVLKVWQILASGMGQPETMSSLYQGINAVPEIFTRLMNTGWNRFLTLQQKWAEKAGSLGRKTEAYKFDSMDEELFKAWSQVYEEEFKRFFNVPQLGLTRFYQERAARFIDKYNLFQTATAQFMYILYLPVEKSFKVLQDKLEASHGKEEKLPEDPQHYYRMYIKILEGHYMMLFKSTEYSRAMSEVLNAMEEFVEARQEMVQDVLQPLPIPTNRDMDELYREIYELKKKVKRLEKKAAE